MHTKWLSYVLVLLQFGLIALLIWYCGVGSTLLSYLMLTFAFCLGLWAIVTMHFRVSILPAVRTDQVLFMSGPYAYIRHPMYAALLIACQAMMLNRPDGISALLWLMLLGVLLIKMDYEERQLKIRFKTYRSYMSKTKRLIPFIY